jgi:hypothetical protein
VAFAGVPVDSRSNRTWQEDRECFVGDWWGIPNRCLPKEASPKHACRPGPDEARLVAGAVGWEVDPVAVEGLLPPTLGVWSPE